MSGEQTDPQGAFEPTGIDDIVLILGELMILLLDGVEPPSNKQ
jgi:hypothetical protein